MCDKKIDIQYHRERFTMSFAPLENVLGNMKIIYAHAWEDEKQVILEGKTSCYTCRNKHEV